MGASEGMKSGMWTHIKVIAFWALLTLSLTEGFYLFSFTNTLRGLDCEGSSDARAGAQSWIWPPPPPLSTEKGGIPCTLTTLPPSDWQLVLALLLLLGAGVAGLTTSLCALDVLGVGVRELVGAVSRSRQRVSDGE